MEPQLHSDSTSLFSSFLGPLHVPPAYEHVVDRIRRSIWLRLVLPGDRLPSERALAESFGVSRVTVREALRVLQGEGLVATSRGSGGGSIVQEPEPDDEGRRQHMWRSRIQLGYVHELRLAVEPMAASLAAERASAEDVERITKAQDALYASSGVATFRQADSAFHLGIAAASGNPHVLRTVEDARANLFLAFDVGDYAIHQETSGKAHAAILTAIVEHDSTAAAVLMQSHLQEAWAEIMTVLEETESHRIR